MDWTSTKAPDAADIETMAQATITALPDAFRHHALRVILRVEEFASHDILKDMQIDDPFELTGLYDGVPLTQKSVSEQSTQPDIIWLFRRPILDEWTARGDVTLANLVAHVTMHELAHHFGWSDEDIAAIDEWWT